MFPSSESLVNMEKALEVSVLLHPAGAVFPLRLTEEQVRPGGDLVSQGQEQERPRHSQSPSLPHPCKAAEEGPRTVLWGELYLFPKIHMLKS